MDKIDFSASLNQMRDNFNYKTRRFPSYSFGNKEQCMVILENAIKHVDNTINEFMWLPEYDKIADWLSNTEGKGLLLAGDVGRGKTSIVQHAIPLIFFHYKHLVIKCTHADDLHKHLESYRNKLIISVDEMGAEPTINNYGTKYEPISILFDTAESNSKILLISTNLNSQEIQQRYGVRVIDRMARLCKIVKFKGESLRK